MISLFSPEEERKMIAVLIYIYKNGSGTCLGRDGAERMEERQAPRIYIRCSECITVETVNRLTRAKCTNHL